MVAVPSKKQFKESVSPAVPTLRTIDMSEYPNPYTIKTHVPQMSK